jgi:transitional endoplasmic reticulum ATPase
VIVIGQPDLADRFAILRVYTRARPVAEDVDLAALARHTDGFSGAEIERLMREAAANALRERVATSPDDSTARLQIEARHIASAFETFGAQASR